MGLLQRALETYESHVAYTQNRDGMTPMAPVAHIVTQANVEVTLDSHGNFVIACAVAQNEPKIIIPATEGSAGRTKSPCPHPLCEQLGYLMPQNEEKYQLYVEQLDDWVNSEYSHPKLRPILNYVKGGSIVDDLVRCGAIKIDAHGMPKNEKTMVRWRIQGDCPEECWKDETLFGVYTLYSLCEMKRTHGLCMVTGKQTQLATQHSKGIFSLKANAKLISSNDDAGFTYRGRFSEAWQAVQIGYEASQKAHNALRWLIQEQGVTCGGRTVLCWNPQGKTVTPVTLPFRAPKPIWKPSDYKKLLKETLESRKQGFQIIDGVVVASFDAATKGRLAVTYYNEFQAHDFLQRLHDWEESCCWCDYRTGIQSPSLYNIIKYAFGKIQKREKESDEIVVDDEILRNQTQRLIVCKLENSAIGVDIVHALTAKVSHIHFGTKEKTLRENVMTTACAVIRKYRYDRFKEEWSMALEPEKKDRSYQFGRLLAVMEKVEVDTYKENEYRQPNALRLQSVFCNRPLHTTNILQQKLEDAYFRQLKRNKVEEYKALMSQIMSVISEQSQERMDAPLKETYVLGYYLQRNELYKKKDKDVEENEYEYTE